MKLQWDNAVSFTDLQVVMDATIFFLYLLKNTIPSVLNADRQL